MSVLATKDRKALPPNDFAIPEKAPGPGSYPIHDHAHAVDALSRASGKPEEGRVRAAVHKKFPNIGKGDSKPKEGSAAEEKGESKAEEAKEQAAGKGDMNDRMRKRAKVMAGGRMGQ